MAIKFRLKDAKDDETRLRILTYAAGRGVKVEAFPPIDIRRAPSPQEILISNLAHTLTLAETIGKDKAQYAVCAEIAEALNEQSETLDNYIKEARKLICLPTDNYIKEAKKLIGLPDDTPLAQDRQQ